MDAEDYIKRCLELAKQGHGRVSPNPMVGAVLVSDGKIIAEGAHLEHGKAHAEVHALEAIKDINLLDNSTLYVNLEPCSHYGQTPPCTDSILSAGIQKVVFGVVDPDTRVSGKGAEILDSKGVTVESGVLAQEVEFFNRRFLTHRREHRPYIILKWAETSDGFIAKENGDSKWISNETSRKLVHQWRAQEDAILVGTNTAIIDNPKLTSRIEGETPKQPIRIFLDPKLKVPSTHALYDGSCRTLCFTEEAAANNPNVIFYQVTFDDQYWNQIFSILHKHNVLSIIIEGGAKAINDLLKNDLWDEARVFKCEKEFGSGIAAPSLKSDSLDEMDIEGDRLQLFFRDGVYFKDYWI